MDKFLKQERRQDKRVEKRLRREERAKAKRLKKAGVEQDEPQVKQRD
jgi:hypothetical protein